MGTGATLVAAQARGLDAIRIEIDAGYCEAARRRLTGAEIMRPARCRSRSALPLNAKAV
jgi:DNA modification methylase